MKSFIRQPRRRLSLFSSVAKSFFLGNKTRTERPEKWLYSKRLQRQTEFNWFGVTVNAAKNPIYKVSLLQYFSVCSYSKTKHNLASSAIYQLQREYFKRKIFYSALVEFTQCTASCMVVAVISGAFRCFLVRNAHLERETMSFKVEKKRCLYIIQGMSWMEQKTTWTWKMKSGGKWCYIRLVVQQGDLITVAYNVSRLTAKWPRDEGRLTFYFRLRTDPWV